jgi:hypothetical protein
MRLTRLSVIAPLLLTTLAIPAPSLRAQDADDSSAGRRGTAPRTSSEKYKAHANYGGASIGAELLTRKEVSKEFASDLNRCCLVVQVAVYPERDGLLNVSLDDFTLIVEGSDRPVRPQSATAVSAKLEKKKNSNGNVTATTGAGIGYESGTYTDPLTGQPVHGHGVTTSTSVAVAVGDRVPAAVAEHDREVIERELSEKSLPEAKIAIPVSGYLYFPLPKQKKDAKYRLEYVLKGETLKLQFP